MYHNNAIGRKVLKTQDGANVRPNYHGISLGSMFIGGEHQPVSVDNNVWKRPQMLTDEELKIRIP